MINPAKNEASIREWIKKAIDDELSCKSILKHRDAPPSPVCFMAQQMGEKYLKALLIFHKKDFPKVHDLKRIATLLESFETNIFNLDDAFNILNKYYVTTRYPGDYPEFTWKDAEKAFKAAQKIKNFVLDKIN